MLGRQLRCVSSFGRSRLPSVANRTVTCSTRDFYVDKKLLTSSSSKNLTMRKVTDVMTTSTRLMSGGDLPAHELVKLPALSPTMEHGTIVGWEKKVGDQLAEGDLLCEIETDKSTMGFETPEEGYLAKIIIPAGTKEIPIGKPLCIIVMDKDDISKFDNYVAPEIEEAEPQPPPVVETPSPPPTSATSTIPPAAAAMLKSAPVPASVKSTGSRPFASPAAKRIAAERGIDLSAIAQGSGMDGMITSKDVEAFKGASTTSGIPVTSGSRLAGPPISGHTDIDLTSMRKTIAKRLQASKLEVPHYYLTVECQIDALSKLRSELNKQYGDDGVKLSVNDFIIKATALASRHVPECNSSWMDTFIRQYNTCDVSVAVDAGTGLITPIVTSVEAKGLAEISSEIRDLAERAREGKLQPNQFIGGTITVSNLGMLGISHFTAIINQPQACILAVGGPKKKVVPFDTIGEVTYKVVDTIDVTLSCDHRVVDGAVGAQWLKYFKKFIEQPSSMLL